MTRSELIAHLAKKNPHLLRKDIEKAVIISFEAIASALEHGNRVELRGFGAFFTRTRKSKMGRNPRTGTRVSVAEKRVPLFRAGKPLNQALNKTAVKD